MKRDDLLDAVGGIDREIIEESQKLRMNRRPRKNRLAVILPIAAAAVLVAGFVSAVLWNSWRTNTGAEATETGEPVETVTLYEKTQDPDELERAAAEAAEEARKQAEEAASADYSEAERQAEEEAERQLEEARKAVDEARRAEEEAKKQAEQAENVEPAADDQGRLLLGLELETNVPEEILQYIAHHEASIRAEIMYSQFADEMGIEKDLGNIYLLHPYTVYQSDGSLPDEFRTWSFPVLMNNRITCSISLTQINGEILLGKDIVFADTLNALLGDRKEHRIVMKDRASAEYNGNPAERPTGEPMPEYEYPETGRTISSDSQVIWDLSIKNTTDEGTLDLLAAYDPEYGFFDRFNTHVFYCDSSFAVYRVHRDEEQRLVMLRSDADAWYIYCDIRSQKPRMDDKASEIIAACEEFYRYYLGTFEATLSQETDRMIAFLYKAGIPNYHSENEDGDVMRYTEEEISTLRDWVSYSYDREKSEEMVPTYIAFYIAADVGYLTLEKPVVCIRMDVPDSEDQDFQKLLEQYFGDSVLSSRPQYFILSADPDREESSIYRFSMFAWPGWPEGTFTEWINGKMKG